MSISNPTQQKQKKTEQKGDKKMRHKKNKRYIKWDIKQKERVIKQSKEGYSKKKRKRNRVKIKERWSKRRKSDTA